MVTLRKYFSNKTLQEVAEDVISVMKNTNNNREFMDAVTKAMK